MSDWSAKQSSVYGLILWIASRSIFSDYRALARARNDGGGRSQRKFYPFEMQELSNRERDVIQIQMLPSGIERLKSDFRSGRACRSP